VRRRKPRPPANDHRNRAIRAYLLDHDGGGVVRAIKDPLLVNCKTGEEIPRR
jgi:hypothetical protein